MLAALLLTHKPCPASEEPSKEVHDLRFVSEQVRIALSDTTAIVAGRYVFEAGADGARFPILYPLPQAAGDGAVDSVVVTVIRDDGGPDTLTWDRDEEGVRFVVTLAPLERRTLAVRYRQVHHGRLRYILTSTLAWGRPLETAEFEVDAGSVNWTSNLPMNESPSNQRPRTLRYRVHDFLPHEDLILVRGGVK